MKIIKSFDPNTSEDDIRSGGGTYSLITYENLLPYLQKAFDIKENERLVGIRVDEDGIYAKIKYGKDN